MEKTERFELRLDEELIKKIDNWMKDTGQTSSRAGAVRQLIDIGLGSVTGQSIRLTDGDKLNFMMLRDIMKHLKIKDAETDVEFVANSIYGGHYWAPAWEMPGLFHSHADRPSDVNLVLNVLDMFDFIESAIEDFSEKEIEALKESNHGYLPKFAGFDGNNESTLVNICSFFVEKMNRFARFKGRNFNSHAPTAERYRLMAKAFEPLRTTLVGRRLGATEIINLLNLSKKPV